MLRQGLLFLLALGVGGAVGTVWIISRTTNFSAAAILEEAREQLQKGELTQAEQLAGRVLQANPQSTDALMIAAEAVALRGHYGKAAAYYLRISAEDSYSDLLVAADVLYTWRHFSAAETVLRRALQERPDSVKANRRIAEIMTVENRRWEASTHLFEVLRQDEIHSEELMALGPFDNSDVLDEALRAVQDDPVPLLGKARVSLLENRPQEALEWLRTIVEAKPRLAEAQARMGRALLDLELDDELQAWRDKLPAEADDHPEIWFVRGQWAQRREQKRAAVRCFWEAVRREPNHLRALYQLGATLTVLGRPETAAPFLERAALITDFNNTLKLLYDTGAQIRWMMRAAEQTESLGRIWEARAWTKLVLEDEREHVAARAALARLQSALDRDKPPRTLNSANPALNVSLADYSLPDWTINGLPVSRSQPSASGQVRFEEVASRVGLDFTYFSGVPKNRLGRPLHLGLGSGVAVLDYDQDGWPDLYLTQGCPWPVDPRQNTYIDRLFRNRGDGSFQDITEFTGLGNSGYGHGAAAGDFDSDGFPDLYVANIGQNRLYHNNGDGTFSDVTEEAGIEGARWTTSCLIVDLNGDGHPDLYDVNYITGDDVYRDSFAAPYLYEGEEDQLWWNLGDGGWEEVTKESGIAGLDGKGMGVIAFDADGSGRISLFIANDTVANHFFLNQTESPSSVPRLEERALLSGLAFDRDGGAMACMGVAVDDIDGDGRLDFYVTNFFDEANTLYLQRSEGLFDDATHQAALWVPSLPMLGFGTQFLDAELDGRPDLVVTNGDIDDHSRERDDRPYYMPPQFYRNLGGSRFEEVPADSLGAFFQGAYLGRGLALVDWNRDGREDFVVTHLDAPVALVSNQTPNIGHFLTVQLRGVQSGRDAIGSSVRVEFGDRTRTRQLTAGDGYQASNQRQLVFGLAEYDRVERLTVRWPSGIEQSFSNLAADAAYLLIEGNNELNRLSGMD